MSIPQKASKLSLLAALVALVALTTAPIGAAPGDITEQATGGVTPGFTVNSLPNGAALGPDGLIWFLERGTNAIARRNADGSVSEFPWVNEPLTALDDITAGPDGNLWFLDFNPPGRIGRVTPAGVVTEVATGGVTPGFPVANVQTIVSGPDGNLWFTMPFSAAVGRITPAGAVTTFPAPVGTATPRGIAVGADGDLWVTDSDIPARVWSVTTSGAFTEEASAGTTPGFSADADPGEIAAGPDGALWFTSFHAGQSNVTRITTGGAVTEYTDLDLTSAYLTDIASGCDRLWVTQSEEDNSESAIWEVTTDGVLTEHTAGMPSGASPLGITLGADGDMWFPGYLNPGRLMSIETGCENPAGPTTTAAAGEPGTAAAPGATPVARPVALTPTFTG